MALFFFALLAGMVTIAGPCILPLLPIILGTSTQRAHPSRPLFIVLGFVLSFSFFAVVLAVFGQRLGIPPELFRTTAAIVIGFFGLVMLFPRIQELLLSRLQAVVGRATPKGALEDRGVWSGFLLGASLGLVWTPCAGPVLGSILTLVAARQNLAQAGALLAAYAFGAGMPMLAIAYGGQTAMTRVRAIAKYAPAIQRIFGALILLVAVGLYTGYDRDVQIYLIRIAPWLFPNLALNL